MNHQFRIRRIIPPSDPRAAPELPTYDDLLQEMRELVDMLPDDQLDMAVGAILDVPADSDWTEMFTQDELDRFEIGKRKLRNGDLGASDADAVFGDAIREIPSEYVEQTRQEAKRNGLHRLTKYMSIEILYESTEVLKSEPLLDIPEEATPEQWADLLQADEEIERGDVASWEEFKRENGIGDIEPRGQVYRNF